MKTNLTEEDVDLALLKRAKKQRTQQSLGAIIARRGTEPEGLAKVLVFLTEGLVKMDLGPNEDHIFGFYIHLVEQLAAIQDGHTPRRVRAEICRSNS